VIKEYYQGVLRDRLPFNPASVIGAAFDDALHGRLEASKEPAPNQPQSNEATATTYNPYPAATTEPPPAQEPQQPEGADADDNGL
jgi:hypothetical protein